MEEEDEEEVVEIQTNINKIKKEKKKKKDKEKDKEKKEEKKTSSLLSFDEEAGENDWNRTRVADPDLSPNFYTSKEPRNRFRNRFQGINSASPCSLAGLYDNPILVLFLAPIDCLNSSTVFI